MKKTIKSLLVAAVTIAVIISCIPIGAGAEDKKYPDILAGYVYSIMNCDTGRSFGLEGVTDFLFEYTGEAGTFYLKDDSSGKYLNANKSKITLSDEKEKTKFVFTRLNYNRYSICANENYFCDNDGGKNNIATLSCVQEAANINACWFVTADGTEKPIRIMPLGDSLTYGNDVDTPAAKHTGYRALLSELLAEKYPNLRFAFVGSQINGGTTKADELPLYRNEGHNAHTAYYLDYGEPYFGIYQLCDEWLAKYQPEVVILMIGTNDIGLNKAKGDLAASQTAGYQLQLMQKIKDLSPVQLFVLASSPPSNGDTSFNKIMTLYNQFLLDNGKKIARKGVEVINSDVYALISELGPTSFCSDNGHMSRFGYDEIAKLHAKNFEKSEYINTLLGKIDENIDVLSGRKEITETGGVSSTSVEPSDDSVSSGTAGTDTDDVTAKPKGGLIAGIIGGCIAVAGVVCAVVFSKKKKK